MLQVKALHAYSDKSGSFLLGCQNFKQNVKKNINENPVVSDLISLQTKFTDKYLGHIFQFPGNRQGKLKVAAIEVKLK